MKAPQFSRNFAAFSRNFSQLDLTLPDRTPPPLEYEQYKHYSAAKNSSVRLFPFQCAPRPITLTRRGLQCACVPIVRPPWPMRATDGSVSSDGTMAPTHTTSRCHAHHKSPEHIPAMTKRVPKVWPLLPTLGSGTEPACPEAHIVPWNERNTPFTPCAQVRWGRKAWRLTTIRCLLPSVHRQPLGSP